MRTSFSKDRTFAGIFINILSILVIAAMVLPSTGSASAQEPSPRIVASEAGDWFWTADFQAGMLDLFIFESAAEGAALLWSGQQEADESGFTVAGYDVHGQDLQPGNYLVVSDGVSQKGLVLEPISMTIFSTDTEVMAGTAPKGREVTASAGPQDWQERIPVQADPETGAWLADFNTVGFDITEDMRPWSYAQIFDADGDANEAGTPPNPRLEAYAWYDRYSLVEWPAGIPVDVKIQNPDYQTTFTPDGSTNWYDFVPEVDLQPGSVITASNGYTTKELTISPLSATVDKETGMVTGVATPERTFHMATGGNFFDNPVEEDITADVQGNWSADLSAYAPLRWLTRGEMWEWDDDGDVTYAVWHGEENVLEIWLAQNELHAFGWPLDIDLAFTVYDPETGQTYEYTAGTEPVNWMESTRAVANAGDLRLGPGMEVSVTDGSITKSTTVQDARIIGADVDNDVVYGYAPGNASLVLRSWEDNPVLRFFNADENGNWTVDYRIPSVNGATVDVNIWDNFTLFMVEEDYDATVWDWNVPNPHFEARVNVDQVEGREWQVGDEVILTVDDLETPGDPDYVSDPKTVEVASWNPNESYVLFNLRGLYELKPGDQVSLSNGTLTKTTVVTGLAFTDIDMESDTVSGIAAGDSLVDIWACDAVSCYNRHVTAVDGNWMADFAHPGSQEDEQNTINIVSNTWVDSQQVDEDGDKTMFGQNTPGMVVFPEWDWLDGLNWPDGTVTITVDGKPECATTKESKDGFFNGNFGEGCDLEIGNSVTFTDGDTTITHVVQNLGVSGVDEVEDTLWGTADEGAVVHVWPHSTGQTLNATADAGGSWQVDFTGTFDLVPGEGGRSQINDAFGNGTAVDWYIPNPRMVIFPEWEWLDGLDWPDGFVNITVAGKPECATTKESQGGFFNGKFGEGCDVAVGDQVTFENGTTSRTHKVLSLAVTNVDEVEDIVAGTADGGAVVNVWPHATGQTLQATADPGGNWQVDFTGTFDLVPGEAGRSQINDEAGSATAVDWSVPWYPLTYTVNTTNDDDDGICDAGHCSLREAINAANTKPTADTIVFNIPGEAPFTIQPLSGYPSITDPVTIDGTTQPGFEGSPLIELDGSHAGEGANGLLINAGDSTVKGLAINRFPGNGINLEGGSGNTIQGNYIGTDLTGTAATGQPGPAVGEYALTVMEACPTYPAGTEINGFVSDSDDPLAPWEGNPVHFEGTDECGSPAVFGASSLIYRYKLEFAEDTELTSIMVSGAAFNGPDNILRVLDEGMNVLGTTYTYGGNSYQTPYVRLSGVMGTVFYIEEYDTSSDWRYRESFVINGPLPLGNGNGVLISGGSSYNLVGGSAPGERNIISGNIWNGVGIFNPGTTGNRVEGNYIGTDLTGTQALGNFAPGVSIGDQAFENLLIGNLISGNRSDAVALFNPGTTGNVLQGNYIGTDASGTEALPNAGAGIWIGEGASDSLIGGPGEGDGNLISGSGSHGVSINHVGTTGTKVFGNKIGTNLAGDAALPNGAGGVYISGSQTWLGGTEPGAGNLISGNKGDGVTITEGVSQAIVQGNYIGTDGTGTTVTGTPGPAVGDYTITAMPGTCPTYPAGTDFDGFISESDDPLAPWSGTSVTFMGTDEDKCGSPETLEGASLIYRYKLVFAEETMLASIAVSGAAFNGSILRVLDADMNVLETVYNYAGNSFSTSYAVLNHIAGSVFYVEEYDWSSTWRFRQSIVINEPLPLGNYGSGVFLGGGASDNQVTGNVISGNRSDGIYITEGAAQNLVQANLVGTDVNGMVGLGNWSRGIVLNGGANNNLIAGNVVAANGAAGIRFHDPGTAGNRVEGNLVGTDITGMNPLGNGYFGIRITDDAAHNTFSNNTIAFNANSGVAMNGEGTLENSLQMNSIFSNGGFGIDLGEDGITRNDPRDLDTGPNNLQNYPILNSIARLDGSVMIRGLLPGTPGTTFRLEFFGNDSCDPSGSGEGQAFLGAATVRTNSAGIARFDVTLAVALPPGTFVTATATDPAGNTSEFSKCFTPAPGWNLVNDPGFGDPSNNGVTALEVFQNKLYAGASNWNTGGQVWRLGDDGLWSQMIAEGFGSGPANAAVIDLAVFQGKLYAGTGWSDNPGQLWRTANGSTWQPVTIDGFGNPENIAVTSFIVFKSMLYAGTGSASGSAQIWRSSTGGSGTWKQVAPDGAWQTGNVTGFAVYKNVLYAAVEPAGGVDAPIQVWRSTNGSDWTVVTADGFGDMSNEATGGFAQFGGYLYLGIRNTETGAQLWRTTNGLNWQMVVGNGFGDPNNVKIESLTALNDLLYAATHNPSMGMQVWRSADGINWEQVAANGFGDSNNFSTLWNSATAKYQGQLLIGTWNGVDGGELWRFTP